jgi:hypothetical protein
MRTLRAMVSSAASLALLCGGGCHPGVSNAVTPIAFRPVAQAYDSGLDTTFRRVVRDEQEFSRYFALLGQAEPPLYVDFKSEMVLFVSGPPGTGRDSIRIRHVEQQGSLLAVIVVSYFACSPTMLQSWPAEAVAIPARAGRVVFNSEIDAGPACPEPGRRKLN